MLFDIAAIRPCLWCAGAHQAGGGVLEGGLFAARLCHRSAKGWHRLDRSLLLATRWLAARARIYELQKAIRLMARMCYHRSSLHQTPQSRSGRRQPSILRTTSNTTGCAHACPNRLCLALKVYVCVFTLSHKILCLHARPPVSMRSMQACRRFPRLRRRAPALLFPAPSPGAFSQQTHPADSLSLRHVDSGAAPRRRRP